MSLGCLVILALSVTNAQAFTTSSNRSPIIRGLSIESSTSPASVDTGSSPDILNTFIPDIESYASGYSTVFDEVPCSICKAADGTIPDDLFGTYFRNGPAMFSAGSILPPNTSLVTPKTKPVADGEDSSRMVLHPFEGDGAVLGVTFPGDGTAVARFRYVRTNAFSNERKKGRRVYNGMDSTRSGGSMMGLGQGNDHPLPLFRHHLLPGLNRKRKNTSNTRAVYWGKKLISLWEGGLPYKMNALALSTEGRSQLGGVVEEDDPFGCKNAYDSNTDRMLFYSCFQGLSSSKLKVYEFNSKFRLVPENGGIVEANLPGFAMISDFVATENYSIFVLPPVSTNNIQFLTSRDPGKSLSLEKDQPAMLYLIPRVGGAKAGFNPKSISIPNDGVSDADLQFINAYEKDNAVVIDVIRSDGQNVKGEFQPWPWAKSLEEYAQSSSKKSLWRYTVQIDNGFINKDCISDAQVSFGVINPSVSGKQHQYIYTLVGGMGSSAAPPQGIAKFDIKTGNKHVWMPREYEFCGEPMYAPSISRHGEDDGYIISVLFNGKKNESEIVILEAKNIKAGPVTRIPLGIAIPHGYYGCFSSSNEAGWSGEEIDRRAKLADKIEGRGNMWNEVKSDLSGLGLRLDDIEEYFGDFFG